MSRLDDLLAANLAPRAPVARKAKPRQAEADLLASLTPWTPPAWAPYPPMARGGTGRQRALPEYVSPRERPELAHRCPGPEAVTDAEIAAWVDADPFVRGGLSPRTARAMAYIATFAPRKTKETTMYTFIIAAILLFPSVASALGCFPLPAVEMKVILKPNCDTAVVLGGSCKVVTTVSNASGTVLSVGRQLLLDSPGSIDGTRKPTVIPMGLGQTFSAPFGDVALPQIVTLAAPGSRFACFSSVLYSNNTSCGVEDIRRQQHMGRAGECVINAAYPAKSYAQNGGMVMACSYAWPCSDGACWFHGQAFVRPLTIAQQQAWGALNCCAACARPNTIPLGSEVDGPYGIQVFMPSALPGPGEPGLITTVLDAPADWSEVSVTVGEE